MATTLARLIDGLERRSTWKNAALAVGGILLSNVAMGAYILPCVEARQPEAVHDGLLVMIDLAPMISAEEVYKIFDLYHPDILGLVRLMYAVDFVMPLAFAVLLMCLIGKMLRYLDVRGIGRLVLLLPFTSLLFDYVENTLSLVLIAQYQDGQVFPTLARVASVATVVKFLGLASAALTVVVLLLRAAPRFITRRTPPPA